MNEKHADKYMLLGLNIAFYRKKEELTQEALAELVGISRTHLSNIEAKKVEKSLSLLLYCLPLFDLSVYSQAEHDQSGDKQANLGIF